MFFRSKKRNENNNNNDENNKITINEETTKKLQEFAEKAGQLVEEGKLQELVLLFEDPIVNQNKECLLSLATSDQFGETVLHRAAYAGNVNIVRFLLENGADASSTVSLYQSTPLHSASAGGNEEVVRCILGSIKLKAEDSYRVINHKTTTGWTALHSAIVRDRYNIVRLLIQYGASVDIENPKFNSREMYYSHLLESADSLKSANDNQNNVINNNDGNIIHNNNNNSKVINLSGVSIQIASDIHIEFHDRTFDYSDIIKPSAPILALLGDIGIPYSGAAYSDFLLHMAEVFELVLVIAGNHEYYNSNSDIRFDMTNSYEGIKEHIKSICNQHPNLLFMDKESILINGVRILGCTLWSYIPECANDICGNSLTDYRVIFIDDKNTNNGVLNPSTSTKWFQDEYAWLKKEIGDSMKRGEESVVVLTHHTPTFYGTSSPQYETHPFRHFSKLDGRDRKWVNCCFSSDLEETFLNFGVKGNSNVKLWAYGHTHYNNDQVIYGTRVVSNQRGYFPRTLHDYNPSFVVHIK